MQENPLTLDEVKFHFDHWRAMRAKKRERIPKSLWDEVKILIGRYSLSDITETLSINTGQKRLLGRSCRKGCRTSGNQK